MLSFCKVLFWKRALLLCLTMGSLLLFSGCGQNANGGQTSAQTNGVSTQRCGLEVSWAIFHSSLKELKRATSLDLAVQGKFTAIIATAHQTDPISTDFSFAISKVLLNPHSMLQNAGTSITIHQTGGWRGDTLCQVSDDPLFRVGEEAILFLHQSSSGRYFVDGGPSGRFEVRDGLVQPVNDEGIKLPPATTEQVFYTMLQEA